MSEANAVGSITAAFAHRDPSCPACAGEGIVCEEHPDRPWGDGDGCCGAPGAPCPLFNAGPLRVACPHCGEPAGAGCRRVLIDSSDDQPVGVRVWPLHEGPLLGEGTYHMARRAHASPR